MSANVLVVKPKTLSRADKKALSEAGIICIEADDPASVRFLTPQSPPMDGDDLWYAAIAAISRSREGYSNTTDVFCQQLAALTKAARQPQ